MQIDFTMELTKIINKLLILFPDFKGKQRIIRFLFGKYLNKQKDIIVHSFENIKYIIPNCKEIVGFELLINGAYEPETVRLIIERLPVNGVFIDIGANIGSISIPVAIKRPDVQVFSIEASNYVFDYLRRNVELNGLKNISIFNKAISNKDDELVDFSIHPEQFGKGFLNGFSDALINKVHTIKLDSLVAENSIKSVDLIKIDIEGYEYFALIGSNNLLTSKLPPDIVFEFEDWAEARAKGSTPGNAQKYLMDLGYRLIKLNKNKKQQAKITTPIIVGSTMILATKK